MSKVGATIIVDHAGERSVIKVTPTKGFTRRLNEEMTYQYQVIYHALTGIDPPEGNKKGVIAVTEHWEKCADKALQGAFGEDAKKVKVKLMALRFDRKLEHSWAEVGAEMKRQCEELASLVKSGQPLRVEGYG